MGSLSKQNHPLRIFVFDSPRTNCQLFYKLFQQHPQLGWGKFYHGFAGAACYGPERLQPRLRHGEAAVRSNEYVSANFPDESSKTFESSTKHLLEAVEETEKEGKIFFGKEHLLCAMKQDIMIDSIRHDPNIPMPVHTRNPTAFPDTLIDTITPIFVIRHPFLMINSFYRTQLDIFNVLPTDEDFEVWTTLRWTQILYDYFVGKGVTPLLVDAEDIVYNTKALTDKICLALGIDASGVKETWDPLPKEYWPESKIAQAYMEGLFVSSGIERRTQEPAEWTLNLGIETNRWKQAYGDDIAAGLRKRAEMEMPTYQYLRHFKVCP